MTLELSVVIPVYNEEASLPLLVEELIGALGEDPERLEFLFINDGSCDGSEEILEEMASRHSAVRMLSLARNSGQSAAMLCGFRAARGRLVVTLDADRQNDPADIPGIVELLGEYDMVCGIRKIRRDSWSKRFASKFANWAHQTVLGDTIRDSSCSLKGFHRDNLLDLPAFKGVHRFLAILLEKRGCTLTQIEVNHRPRLEGESKYTNLGRLAKTWQDLLGVRWLLSRDLSYEVKEKL